MSIILYSQFKLPSKLKLYRLKELSLDSDPGFISTESPMPWPATVRMRLWECYYLGHNQGSEAMSLSTAAGHWSCRSRSRWDGGPSALPGNTYTQTL